LLEIVDEDILAIQEPWLNRQAGKGTYCPRSGRYNLIHQPVGRAAIYIHKRWPAGQWEYKAGHDWCRITLLADNPITIWSVYRPTGQLAGQPEECPLAEIARQMAGEAQNLGSYILAGDLNHHHPLWDLHSRNTAGVDTLLALAETEDLTLRTPYGAITRAPQGTQRGRTSTIDHIWASRATEAVYSGLPDRLRSDHYPQTLTILESRALEAQQSRGWSWRQLDHARLACEATLLAERLGGYPALEGISTTEGLDQAFQALTTTLQRMASDSAPRLTSGQG
jgi:hypothetical protein